MMNRKSRKNIKDIQKELVRLKGLLKAIELRPCHGDVGLRKKEEEIHMLKREIYSVEKEANKLILFIERGGVKLS